MLLQSKGPHQRPFFSGVHMLLVAREGHFAKFIGFRRTVLGTLRPMEPKHGRRFRALRIALAQRG